MSRETIFQGNWMTSRLSQSLFPLDKIIRLSGAFLLSWELLPFAFSRSICGKFNDENSLSRINNEKASGIRDKWRLWDFSFYFFLGREGKLTEFYHVALNKLKTMPCLFLLVSAPFAGLEFQEKTLVPAWPLSFQI